MNFSIRRWFTQRNFILRMPVFPAANASVFVLLIMCILKTESLHGKSLHTLHGVYLPMSNRSD